MINSPFLFVYLLWLAFPFAHITIISDKNFFVKCREVFLLRNITKVFESGSVKGFRGHGLILRIVNKTIKSLKSGSG
jgi:hypothetical protein